MLSRANPIPLTPRKGIRRRVIKSRSFKVIKETRALHPLPFRVLSLIPQPSNRVVNPRKITVFIRKNLVHYATYMVNILMSVLFYLTCIKNGKLNHLLLKVYSPLVLLHLLLHLNRWYLPILFLTKDILLTNLHKVRKLN